MSKTVRILKALLLLAVTGSITVFIAACYGMPTQFFGFWTIRAKTSSNTPIPGLSVTLVQYIRGDTLADSLYNELTNANGEVRFRLQGYQGDGFGVRVSDIDGAQNGGPYQERKISKDTSDVTEVIFP
jgi:hypothetical protein